MENPENPICSTCKKIWKPEDTDIKKSGEVCKTCKDCRIKGKKHRENNKEKKAEQDKKYRENNKEKIKEKKREYYENNKEKLAEYYENNKEKIAEYRENNKEKIAEYYENNKEKIKEKKREYRENNKEKIKEKAKEYRENNKEKLAEYRENNKEKLAEYRKEYYEKNKETRAEKAKEYRENNKEKIKEKKREYRENNKEKIREKDKQYKEENKCEHNKRFEKCKICNLSLYLVNLQRYNIWRCLKLSSQNKTKSSIDYMGCDADYFIEYFKKKMDLWNENNEIKMNWDNIHIDHIKPVSSFNLDDEEEFNNCCNYTNLQPLLATYNISKSNKWTDEDEVYWNENIKNKEYIEIYLSV